MPSRSGLYNDYLNDLASKEYFEVRDTVRRRARSASNVLAQPLHHIWTDEKGSVQEVSRGFCAFTGYEKEEMIGRNCNFLQGKDTNPTDVMELRLGIKNRRTTSVVIVNYRKDGSPFWNILTIRPERQRFSSEIIGLPIPPSMQSNPRLCCEDVFALISVFSSVPRAIKPSVENIRKKLTLEDSDTASTDTESQASRPSTPTTNGSNGDLYRHVNYASFFGQDSTGEGRVESDTTYEFIAETSLPTNKGRFRVRAYRDPVTGAEPLALIVGNIESQSEVVCRVHDQCVTSEVLGSLRCDCKEQLDLAMKFIQDNGSGMVLYLPQEGRGIGLANKIAAYAVQETGLDTVDANRHLGLPDDARRYDAVRDILDDLNIDSVKLLTNNPRKISCLKELGVMVTGRLPCVCTPTSEFSYKYVEAKAARMGHMINMESFR